MTSPALYGGVAARAIADEIAERICDLVIRVVKQAPGYLVVNVHWSTQLRLSDTALLAGVVVALASLVFLALPIRTAPLDPAAFPVVVSLAPVPCHSALGRTETLWLGSLDVVSPNPLHLPAPRTGSPCVLMGVETVAATILRLLFAGFVDSEGFAAA